VDVLAPLLLPLEAVALVKELLLIVRLVIVPSYSVMSIPWWSALFSVLPVITTTPVRFFSVPVVARQWDGTTWCEFRQGDGTISSPVMGPPVRQ
jgi:hypothetical protein